MTIIGAAVALGAGSCGNGKDAITAHGGTSTTGTPPSAPNTAAGLTHLKGRAMAKSDVQTLPDHPFSSGKVIAVPAGQASRLWQLAGLSPAPPTMARAQFGIDPPGVEQVAGVTAHIASDGGFTFDLPSGRYLFCLADVFPGTLGTSSQVAGCAEGPVDAQTPNVSLTYGEAGVTLTARG